MTLAGLIKLKLPVIGSGKSSCYAMTDKITSQISIGSKFSIDPKRLMYQDYDLKKVHLLNVSDRSYTKDEVLSYQQLGCTMSEINLADELDFESEDEDIEIDIMERIEMSYRHIRKLIRDGKHIIVHDHAGANRPAVVVVYYFMRRIYHYRDALKLEEWLSAIVSAVGIARSCICISFGYMVVLRELERLLRIRLKAKPGKARNPTFSGTRCESRKFGQNIVE